MTVYIPQPLTSSSRRFFCFWYIAVCLAAGGKIYYEEENPNGKNEGLCRCQPEERRGEKHLDAELAMPDKNVLLVDVDS